MKTTNKPRFPEIKPHPDPVDPAQLLDEIYDLIRTFVILTDEQAAAVTLWIAHTYFMDIVEITALLLVNSPEKACGKTQLLLLLERLTSVPSGDSNLNAS
jgi:putative DNA primase/helicase